MTPAPGRQRVGTEHQGLGGLGGWGLGILGYFAGLVSGLEGSLDSAPRRSLMRRLHKPGRSRSSTRVRPPRFKIIILKKSWTRPPRLDPAHQRSPIFRFGKGVQGVLQSGTPSTVQYWLGVRRRWQGVRGCGVQLSGFEIPLERDFRRTQAPAGVTERSEYHMTRPMTQPCRQHANVCHQAVWLGEACAKWPHTTRWYARRHLPPPSMTQHPF